MSVLAGLEPAAVLGFFEEICSIPHGSGNTKEISDYCVSFAKERGLRFIQDPMNNVILFKEGTDGYRQSEPVILQGHLDMVCEKTAGSVTDPEKDGVALSLKEEGEGGMLYAQGTTLGGDDGIAVAYALALLDSRDIPHPPLEVVLTVDEEIGMLGAASLDCSPLTAKRMINLDSEDEGILWVSCAGGASAVCRLPVTFSRSRGILARLSIGGLSGGHSGTEIDKQRGNAHLLLARVLEGIGRKLSCSLISVTGGQKDNAIPREASADLVLDEADVSALNLLVSQYEKTIGEEYGRTDPALSVEISYGEKGAYRTMDADSQKRVLTALRSLPDGVVRMSANIPGLVQTSLNMGVLHTERDEVVMVFSVRSSVDSEKKDMLDRVAGLMEMLGGSVEITGDYPAWEYNPDSRLQKLMISVFEEWYGRKPQVCAVHAGLECGLFAGKISGLDCVALGPDIKDIHTANEHMDLASVKRVWEFLLEILKRLK